MINDKYSYGAFITLFQLAMKKIFIFHAGLQRVQKFALGYKGKGAFKENLFNLNLTQYTMIQSKKNYDEISFFLSFQLDLDKRWLIHMLKQAYLFQVEGKE